jgi:hypothetical protein
MHSKSIWRPFLLTALAALATTGVGRAQPQNFGEDYAPPDTVFPFPLGSTHPEEGGLYTAGEYVQYRQTNPLKDQIVAVRGLAIVDNTTNIPPFGVLPVPTFIGSGQVALDVHQVTGPNDYQPGFAFTLGYKFADGSAWEFKYMYITEVNLHASATQVPAGFAVGQNFENSFLFSNVFGFPNDYNGPSQKLATDTGTSGSSAPGIWNGASIMTEQFLQRTQMYEMTYRQPIFETETYRLSGIVGPRFVWIWERYKWTAADIDLTTNASGPQFEAQYNNIVSNRLYGAHAGFQQECYLGHGFATICTIQGGAFVDTAKTEAIYELARGAVGPGSKRALHYWLPSLEAQATVGISWFPIEGVELRAGYDFQAFFNTESSPNPIDFNYGAVNPQYISSTVRFLDGLNIGLAFNF